MESTNQTIAVNVSQPYLKHKPVEQTTLSSISALNDAFISLANRENSENGLYFELASLLNELNWRIQHAENLGVEKSEIKSLIADTRGILSTSKYIYRMQNWPRGYQGDFETIEHMNVGMSGCKLDSIEACLEYYSQMLPISQQHRNKLIFQERLARTAISENKNILSIGCGGAIDIVQALDGFENYTGRISFIDMDDGALALARERTASYSFTYSNRNIVRGVGKEDDGTYDLVICGGLFDYLEDRVAGMLLGQIEKKLATNGQVFLSNIACNNPFRIQMEYMADWELIERTESQVEALIRGSFKQPLDISLERDATGLAILCVAKLPTLN